MTLRPLPHSQITHAHMVDYLAGVAATVAASAQALESSREFKAAYKNSLAAYVTLKSFGRNQLRFVRSAADLSRRLPIFIACGQQVEANAALRRYIELVAWFAYFKDHPVEHEEFERNPSTGYVRYEDNPIAHAAHREVGYYFAYLREKSCCQSGSVLWSAIADLQRGYGEASGFVHAAPDLASSDPFDKFDPAALRQYAARQRSVLAAGVVIVAWILPNAVHTLDAVGRSWFDWFVGKSAANALRSEAACDA